MFVESRDQSRQFFFALWRKLAASEPLSPLEHLVANVIRAHPEYHRLLGEGERAMTRDFAPGETNPFMHLGLHVALVEQLQTDRPAGIQAVHRSLVMQAGGDVHEAEHRMLDCLAQVLWQASQRGGAPDEQDYLARLKALLK